MGVYANSKLVFNSCHYAYSHINIYTHSNSNVKHERMINMEIKLTKDNFNSVVEGGGKTVLIDFWATWCGPCKMLAPVIEQLANERTDVTVCKVNVDEEQELAVKFGIQSIPTLVLLKDGKECGRAVGYRDYKSVNDFIDM